MGTLHRVALNVVCSLLLVFVVGCSPSSSPQTGSSAAGQAVPAQLVTVKAGTLATVGDAGWWVAIDQGYFREQGINLEYETFDSAAAMVAPLAGGQLDVGGGAISAGLFNAIARGVEIKAVADKSSSPRDHGTVGLVVRKDLWDSGRIQGPADLRGLKIAFPGAGIAPETEIAAFLQTAGLSLKDLEIVTMSFSDMIPALANGSIDLASAPEPFLTTAKRLNVGHVWKRSDELMPGHLTAVVLYSPKFIAEQPEVAKKLLVAYLKGVRDYNDAFFKEIPAKRKLVVDALVKYTPLKEPTLYDHITVQGLDPNGMVPIESLERDQEYFLSTGAQEQRIDLTKVVDPTYAEAAVKALGRYQ
jgi:NitT/TauT family transport system substrate-binding protein